MNRSDFDLGQQNQSTDSKIVASLERIAQAFRVLLWNESKTNGLSPIQMQVLIFLLHHGEEMRKVSYLASEFNMTKATISDTVKALEQKGLISKEYDQYDTRSYCIHLSAAGKAIAGRTALFTKELKAPIELLDADDKENLLLSLIGIIRHLNKTGIITIQRMCFTCSHYRPGPGGNGHFCQLINQSLAPTELRVDCPEHLPM
ncbi:MAG TPA: MarR family winged helix-turn-helix transcriptional regulator [Parapedobacter sp.]|uniref:MarR family winged helix-turn-helix transcriptional regulator n=1 Tax=Parapedobacter sp. TaxID=1958893 RepID=UPI002C3B0853|nr:MarR family winged helix-turn-helix transcriptional regulator [Parapedobacter sp.]HWK59593.1 MarR family winged helix-turn-helix transcriptional regulator [Parapedobacter sp.]